MGRKRKSKTGFVGPKDDSSIQPEIFSTQPEPMPVARARRTWHISTPTTLIVLAASGLVVFLSGLSGPFMDDDGAQIISNPVVQSITHIQLLFEGGTFYSGGGLSPLTGIYYRPLMLIVFSLIYTLFGPQALAFHVFQLILCIATAFLVFLIFRYTFRPVVALLLSLIFLVHPIDSQAVFAIASIQEPLFLFFGLLALWILLRFSSTRSLFMVAACLFLSMLSKETGIIFVAMSLLYLFWFNRERLRAFAVIIALPVICYLALRINAVGLIKHNVAPIGSAKIASRLLTMPSILLFYFTKLVFPLKLSSGYFWVYTTFSFQHVLFPLFIDVVIVAALLYGGKVVRRRLSPQYYLTYLFFGAWLSLGLIVSMQLIPLDMTASETWFYFPIVGLLGMIGLIVMALHLRVRSTRALFVITIVAITTLGVRSAIRGTEWDSVFSRAAHDVAASSEDYIGYTDLAEAVTTQGKFNEAKTDELRAIAIYPSYDSYDDLGLTYGHLGDYQKAFSAFSKAAKFSPRAQLYENTGEVMLLYGSPSQNKQFLESTIRVYPRDSTLWMYLAIIEDQTGDNVNAKAAVSTAAHYGYVPQIIYDSITNDRPFAVYLADLGKTATAQ